MTTQPAILAIDQGTTSSRAMIFRSDFKMISSAQQEFPQIYPQEGWVEHEPDAIWHSVVTTARSAIHDAQSQGYHIATIGMTNQRETTVLWEKSTGKALYNAIVWQDRRTAPHCKILLQQGQEELIQRKTGLLLDPYFSATKIAWILDNVDGARAKAEKGDLAFGTIDSYLLWRLTDGAVHATDATNASRTSLFNIHTQEWDAELLELFSIPHQILPEVKDCAADFGVVAKTHFGYDIPIQGMAGDQHAATFGQACFDKGDIKSTYGTGCFVMANTGKTAVTSHNRLLTTTAWRLNGQVDYALEGSIFIAGAVVQWLRDEMGVISSASETQEIVSSLTSNGGVYLVPAFTGLGAPWWDAEARGAIYGLSRGTGRKQIIRAALESVGYQTADLLHAMQKDGADITRLKVDGGMAANNWLMQFLADILNLPIDRPLITETTALGAASLAGLQAGLFSSLDDIKNIWQRERRFEAAMPEAARSELLQAWAKAIAHTLTSQQG